MALKTVDAFLQSVCNALTVRYNATEVLRIKLFQNDYVPTTADTLANYVEATFPGYSFQNLNLTWTVQGAVGHVAGIIEKAHAFTRNASGAAQLIYGYMVTDASGNNLYYAERDPAAPISLANNGDSYTITPRVTVQDLST